MNPKLFILSVLHTLSLACQINYECPRNQYCGSDGYCHPMGSTYPMYSSRATRNDGAYRSCYFQTDCMSTETCANNRCVPKSYIQSSNKDCTISLQCGTAETCQNGRCVTTMMGNMPGGGASGCLVDSQCWNKDEKCVNGQCQIVLGSLTTRINICQYDSECSSGQSCIQSRCSTSTCKTDRDCRNTDICVMGSCVEAGLAKNYENRFNSQKKTTEKYGPDLTIERTCGVNEVFVSCRSNCEPTCVDPNRICQMNCNFGRGCQCGPGHVRHLSHCIPLSQCPPINSYGMQGGIPFACSRDSDCQNFFICLSGTCQRADVLQGQNLGQQNWMFTRKECRFNDDCNLGERCIGNFCSRY